MKNKSGRDKMKLKQVLFKLLCTLRISLQRFWVKSSIKNSLKKFKKNPKTSNIQKHENFQACK